METPYRTAPPTYQVLDIRCRRCGMHGLQYAYYPAVRPDPGPLCRTCCIEWQGLTKFAGGRVGADGLFAFPLGREWTVWYSEVKKIKVITVVGERPDISPWFDD